MGDKDHDEGDDHHHDEDQSSVPDVVLSADHKGGEEGEDVLFKQRAKLYRFDSQNKEWRERGTGDAKLLKNKEGKVRLLMRRDKTYKICANHYVSPHMKLQENKSNDKSWIWNCPADYAEETPSEEIFAIRFANVDHTKEFKKGWEDAQKIMEKFLGPASPQKQKEGAASSTPPAATPTAAAAPASSASSDSNAAASPTKPS